MKTTESIVMKRGSTLFLRTAIIAFGAVVLAICTLALPLAIQAEAKGDFWDYGPILLGLYAPAVPFFYALWQGLKLLGYIDAGTAFSALSVRALKKIRTCAAVITLFFILGLPYLFHLADADDAPGVFALGLAITFAAMVITVFAALLQRLFAQAVALKSENDLTV